LETDYCPNYKTCQIILIDGFASNPPGKDFYERTYCIAGEEYWSFCKRYLTKHTLNLCPDFLMPDSSFSLDEILDKLEE
jgi:hypothetical protein